MYYIYDNVSGIDSSSFSLSGSESFSKLMTLVSVFLEGSVHYSLTALFSLLCSHI